MDVAHTLKSWNLELLIPVFQNNNVDSNNFFKLTPDLIKELIPSVGQRIIFQENFENLKATTFQSEEVSLASRSSSSIDVISSIPIPSSTPIEINEDLEDNPSHPVPIVFETIRGETSSSVFTGVHNHATVGFSDIQITKTPFYIHNSNCASNTGLEDLLHSSLRGKIIINSYKKNNQCLNNQMRDKLVELIIENELGNDHNKRITLQRFDDLSSAIVAIFPKECKEVYFAKGRQNKNGKTRYIGRGKLFFKYYNYRHLLRNNNLLESKTPERKEISNDCHSSSDPESEEDEEEVKTCLEWLKHNKEPYSKVEKFWATTFRIRKALLSKLQIHEYFNTFPILKNTNGYNLFNIDFEKLFPEKDVFYKNWNLFADKIFKYAKTNYRKDKFIKKILEELDDDGITNEGRDNRILKILPYLVKPVAVNKKWKPSRTEIDEGFIIHVKNVSELQGAIEQREAKLKLYKLTFQPTPIIVGEDLDSIQQVYVRINSVLYEIETPLKAIEITFKAIHALNAIYADEAEQVWLIIQKGLFRINTEFDNIYTSVTTILPHLIN